MKKRSGRFSWHDNHQERLLKGKQVQCLFIDTGCNNVCRTCAQTHRVLLHTHTHTHYWYSKFLRESAESSYQIHNVLLYTSDAVIARTHTVMYFSLCLWRGNCRSSCQKCWTNFLWINLHISVSVSFSLFFVSVWSDLTVTWTQHSKTLNVVMWC